MSSIHQFWPEKSATKSVAKNWQNPELSYKTLIKFPKIQPNPTQPKGMITAVTDPYHISCERRGIISILQRKRQCYYWFQV